MQADHLRLRHHPGGELLRDSGQRRALRAYSTRPGGPDREFETEGPPHTRQSRLHFYRPPSPGDSKNNICMPVWLFVLAWVSLGLAFASVLVIAVDLLAGHRQHMWI